MRNSNAREFSYGSGDSDGAGVKLLEQKIPIRKTLAIPRLDKSKLLATVNGKGGGGSSSERIPRRLRWSTPNSYRTRQRPRCDGKCLESNRCFKKTPTARERKMISRSYNLHCSEQDVNGAVLGMYLPPLDLNILAPTQEASILSTPEEFPAATSNLRFCISPDECEVITAVLTKAGARSLSAEAKANGELPNIHWETRARFGASDPLVQRRFQRFQRINRFLGIEEVLRLDTVFERLSQLDRKQALPTLSPRPSIKSSDGTRKRAAVTETHNAETNILDLSFVSATFMLPHHRLKFVRAFEEWKGDWRIQPYLVHSDVGLTRRSGFVSNKMREIVRDRDFHNLVSKVDVEPLCISGRSFTLHCFVAITSIEPMRLYLYDEGLVSSTAAARVHLRPGLLQWKARENLGAERFESPAGSTSKTSPEVFPLHEFWSMLSRSGRPSEELKQRLREICRIALMAMEPRLNASFSSNGRLHIHNEKRTGFAFVRLDFIVSANADSLHLISIEPCAPTPTSTQSSLKPSLASSVFERDLFERMIGDLLHMIAPKDIAIYDERSSLNGVDALEHSTGSGRILNDTLNWIWGRDLRDPSARRVAALLIWEALVENERRGGFDRLYPCESWRKYRPLMRASSHYIEDLVCITLQSIQEKERNPSHIIREILTKTRTASPNRGAMISSGGKDNSIDEVQHRYVLAKSALPVLRPGRATLNQRPPTIMPRSTALTRQTAE